MKTKTDISLWELLTSQKGSRHASSENGSGSKALFGKEEGGKEYKVVKGKEKEDNPEILQ